MCRTAVEVLSQSKDGGGANKGSSVDAKDLKNGGSGGRKSSSARRRLRRQRVAGKEADVSMLVDDEPETPCLGQGNLVTPQALC
eukprot:9550352-Karenia_brevis.AAC.1